MGGRERVCERRWRNGKRAQLLALGPEVVPVVWTETFPMAVESRRGDGGRLWTVRLSSRPEGTFSILAEVTWCRDSWLNRIHSCH